MKVGLSISWIVVQRIKTVSFSFSSVCSNCKYVLRSYQASKIICESKIQHLPFKQIVLKNYLTDRWRTSYLDKFKTVNWNIFKVTCKNKRSIFTSSIDFTGPLSIGQFTRRYIEFILMSKSDK